VIGDGNECLERLESIHYPAFRKNELLKLTIITEGEQSHIRRANDFPDTKEKSDVPPADSNPR
jgi:hypothetical protein